MLLPWWLPRMSFSKEPDPVEVDPGAGGHGARDHRRAPTRVQSTLCRMVSACPHSNA